jgi:protein-glutamine gamma-glutamyltransferase
VKARLFAALPLLVALASFAAATRAWPASALLATGALASVVFAARVDAGKLAQRTASLLAAFGVVAFGDTLLGRTAHPGKMALDSIWSIVAMTALTLVVLRRAFAAREGGAQLDFAALAIALAASGERHIGHAFTVTAVVFVAAGLAATNAERDPRLGFARLEARAPWRLAVLLSLTAAGTAGAMVVLPILQGMTQHRIEQYVFADHGRSGFTGAVRVGVHPRILESDELVMRVYGPHTDYLRGAVFDHFDGVTWQLKRDPSFRLIATARGGVAGAETNELRMVGDGADRDRGLRYFLPLGARRLGTERGGAMADVVGTLRPLADAQPTPLFFETGGAGDLAIAGPGAQDHQLPPSIAGAVTRLGEEWTAGATTPRDKLARIELRLNRDYRYSLDADPPGNLRRESAILRFLLRDKTGHCEYFATAMTLIARALGIPARVIAGYRVTERNTVGGYEVVRERDAHAWVEAWVDGEGWQRFEPTPASPASARREAPVVGAFADWIAASFDRALEALGRTSLRDLLSVLAAFVALYALVRAVRARRDRAKRRSSAFAPDRPLACLDRLERALANRGAARAPSESLEGWAARLRETAFAEAATPIARYCALRYGGEGDERSVTEALDAYVARIAVAAAVAE